MLTLPVDNGDACMFMKTRPSEFTPAMQAARIPDAVPNHPGSANVQRTNAFLSPVFPLYSTPFSRVSLTFPHPYSNSSPSNQCPPFTHYPGLPLPHLPPL